MLYYFKVRYDLFTGVFYGLKSMDTNSLSITGTSINPDNHSEIYYEAILDDPSLNDTYYQTKDDIDSYLYISIKDEHRVFATHYAIQPISIDDRMSKFFPKSYS